MIYHEALEGHSLRTGDLIATVDGGGTFYGALFGLIGMLIPGKPDHIVLYLGPDGLCVEAGPRGVNLFRFFNERWDSDRMQGQRGIVDAIYGFGNLARARIPDPAHEFAARQVIRNYVLEQVGKPFNWDFNDPDNEEAFYCSQLAYAAFKRAWIQVNVAIGAKVHPSLLHRLVTPEAVWNVVQLPDGKAMEVG